jgi:hypothetical protein
MPIKECAEMSTQTIEVETDAQNVANVNVKPESSRKNSSFHDLNSTFDGGIDKIEDPVRTNMDTKSKKVRGSDLDLNPNGSENPENCKACSIF